MVTPELLTKLRQMNTPHESYSIGEISNESLCFICENTIWEIFYSERGHRIEERCYSDENDACLAFLERLTRMLGAI